MRGVVVRHRLEVLAHGGAVEQARRRLAAVAARASRRTAGGRRSRLRVSRTSRCERTGVMKSGSGSSRCSRPRASTAASTSHSVTSPASGPPSGSARRIVTVDRLPRARLLGVLRARPRPVVDRRSPRARRSRPGSPACPRSVSLPGRRRGARHPAAHQHEVDRQARHPGALDSAAGRSRRRPRPRPRRSWLPSGASTTTSAVRVLERALEDQVRGLAGLVARPCRWPPRRPWRPASPRPPARRRRRRGRRATTWARPSRSRGLELDDVDAGARQVERAPGAAPAPLFTVVSLDLLVDHVGDVARHARREKSLTPADRVPLAVEQPHGDELPGAAARRRGRATSTSGVTAVGLLEVARHLEAEDERRQGDDLAGRGHGLVVGAGDGRLDDVRARLGGRLDRRVERRGWPRPRRR